MKLGIVGGGVVGSATARAFLEHVDGEVRVYDLLPERRTHDLMHTLATDLVFVCLPTPKEKDSLACNVRYIENFFKEVYDLHFSHRFVGALNRNFVLRSTVPIGTTRRLREQYGLPNLCHSPEFLTARCAFTDAQIPARNVVGGHVCEATLRLMQLYERRFPSVPIHRMSSDESEAVKLLQNAFFAVKVSYWNEARAICDKLGLSWLVILSAILADGRIAHSHTQVPGCDGHFGFGGTCLPKDIANLITCMEAADVRPDVCRAAYVRNEMVDRPKVV